MNYLPEFDVCSRLGNVSDDYFDAVAGKSPEAVDETPEYLSSVAYHVESPKNILSVGIGGGAEIHNLLKIYSDNKVVVHGVDASRKAIESTQRYLNRNKIKRTKYILAHANAVSLTKATHGITMDVIVVIATLHEVFSYHPCGRDAWRRSLFEMSKSLAPGGILFIMDVAAPLSNHTVTLSFNTIQAQQFYLYFSQHYRCFNEWSGDERDKFAGVASCKPVVPKCENWDLGVDLTLGAAAEVLTHFEIYMKDFKRNRVTEFDPSWRELDEAYTVPNPARTDSYVPLNPVTYGETITDIGNLALGAKGEKLALIESALLLRPQRANFLMEHFCISDSFTTDTSTYFHQLSSRMKMVFRRVRSFD